MGEIVAEKQAESLKEKMVEGSISLEEFQNARQKSIEVSRLAAATSAFIIGADVQVASQTALNAAQNHGLSVLVRKVLTIVIKKSLKKSSQKALKNQAKRNTTCIPVDS